MTVGITAPIIAALGGSAKAAIDFETAFAGVRKTVGGSKAELDDIALRFRNLSKDVPVTAVELSKIGEMAGQLGVKKENIVAFTKTIADISVATNLTADQAGASFARLANIMQLPQTQFSNLGSTVVALGNFGASTEQEMLDMALRIAGAGATAGLSASQVLGLANALSSVGLEAEAGGTAMSKVIIQIASAAKNGGESLQKFAAVAGMSGAQFKQLFAEDAGKAVGAFLQGMSRIKQSGGDLLGTVQSLGFEEVRLRDAMLRAANAGSLVADSLALGNKAFSENTELTRAAEERYKTTANQLKLLWNQITEIGVTLGQALIPVLLRVVTAAKPLIEHIAKAVEWFGQLPQPVQTAAFAIAGIVAAIGPLLVIAGSLISAIGSVAGALALIAPAGATVAAGASTATLAVGGLKLALGALGTVGAATAAFFAGWKFGSWIGEVTGATDAVGKFTARLLYGKEAAAQYDAMRRAQRQAESMPKPTSTPGVPTFTLPAEAPPPATPPTGGKPFNPLAGFGGDTSGPAKQVDELKKKLAELDFALKAAAKSGVDSTIVAKEYGSQITDLTNKAAIFGVKLPESFKLGQKAVLDLKIADILAKTNEDMRREAERINREREKDQKESLDRMNKAFLENADAESKAVTESAIAYEKQTLSKTDFEIRQLERARDAEIASLNKSTTNYAATVDAVKNNFAQKMDEVRRVHDDELADMKRSVDSWGNRFKDVIGSIPGLLKSALTGGGGFGGFGKALSAQLGESLLGKGATDLLTKVTQSLSGKLSSVFGTGFVSQFASMIPGIGGAIGALAGPLISKVGSFFKNLFGKGEGRQTVEEFAKSFGGFDALRNELNKLGAQGEQLWIQLTQKVGKGNKEQAAAAIEAIKQALDDLKAKEQETADAATKAEDAKQAQIDESTQKYRDQIKALDDELQSLEASVASEAPEEQMGAVEKLQRERIDAIKKQKEELQQQMQETTDAATSQVETVADAVATAIKDKFKDPFVIKFEYQTSGEPPRGIREGEPNPNEPGGASIPGAASGIFTRTPTVRVFGEGGEAELGGPVDFMAKALAGALLKVGGGDSSGVGSTPLIGSLVIQGNDTGELANYIDRVFLPRLTTALRRGGTNASDFVTTLQNLGVGG